ncbi:MULTISPECIES: hypothetical protein [unclassified Methanoculleus]|uniref:hypothetical protein n=1 Tax=unclassified Methanoculleus TaxID=2619537 RepID=UPI0025F0579C|nr:hypothetical protein [Methanoculleus sp. UBA377]
MLLFKPYHVEAVILGRKTQTRRNWKKPRVKIGSRHLAKTVMLSPVWFARVELLNIVLKGEGVPA